MSTLINFDVDIDFSDRDKALSGLRHVVASIDRKGTFEKHNTGVYFQDIPRNPFTNQANIDYKKAQDLGYFKVDCLNVSIYEGVRSEEHLLELMKEPDWTLLDIEEIVQQLFHIGDYFWLVKKMHPRSVDQLAMLLAVMRPSKKHLADSTWDVIEKEVWEKPADGSYHFKRAHGIAYSMAIVVQMNLLVEQASQLS
jgi:hypothetical protein